LCCEQFFQQERVRSLARDVRRAGLDALTDVGRPGNVLLLGPPSENVSPGRCVRRTRAAAMAQRDRCECQRWGPSMSGN
jgi:hypothetical protein